MNRETKEALVYVLYDLENLLEGIVEAIDEKKKYIDLEKIRKACRTGSETVRFVVNTINQEGIE